MTDLRFSKFVPDPNDHKSLSDELDSYMFQTVGHHAIDLYAEAMGLPLYRRVIQGSSVECGWDYHRNEEDEVEDLYALLEEVKVRQRSRLES